MWHYRISQSLLRQLLRTCKKILGSLFMKILWLTNVPTIKIKQQIGGNNVTTGGWLDGISEQLLKEKIELCVLFPYGETVSGKIENCSFRSFTKKIEHVKVFEDVIKEFAPDVIHIFGTEYHHTLSMMQVCEKLHLLDRTVVSIQGLKCIYSVHYFANLPNRIVHSWSIRDLLKNDNIARQKHKFEKSGKDEIKALKIAKNVIGRTDWDKACCFLINPNLNYYFCNETLRGGFYSEEWKYEKCEKHSIFVSQSSYPIKGFHMVLQALTEVLRFYPDAKVYTTGKDLLHLGFKDRLRLNSYQKYIIKLIKKNKLRNNVVFKGFLNEENMVKTYLNANVFVSASSIENSPNSVGEAMLLGVPTISSDVGGVKNMLTHGEDGLIYPFEEPYMLAYYICQLFENQELQESFSNNAKKHAKLTHNQKINKEKLIEIYEKIKKK